MRTYKNQIAIFISLLACCAAAIAREQVPDRKSTDKLLCYPQITEAETNDDFVLEVCSGDGQWHKLPCYSVLVDEVKDGRHHNEKASFAFFDFEGSVTLRAVSRRQSVESARIRPLSYALSPAVSGDTLTFSLAKPANLSLEVNGDIFHNLHIFANPMDAERPAKLKDKNLIYFGPGYHKISGGVLEIPSGKKVYVDGGAWVEGTLRVKNAENVRICGHGIVRPQRGYGVEIVRSRNVSVEGLILTQCPVGGSDGVCITNVKSMTNYGWGDGLNVFASSNVLFDGVFCRNSDDCTTVYATRKGHIGGCSNVEMRKSTLWADVAHPIFVGLHGAAAYKRDVMDRKMEFTEDPDEVVLRHDVIEDIRYRNIDILEHAEKQVDYQGCMSVCAGDNNIVRNILFEDIRVENFRTGQLFNIRIFHNRKYCEAPGLSISGITFRNISYEGDNAELSIIEGFSPERSISNICFENLILNGRHIHDDMPGKPKWYKTSDFARMFIGNHVNNVSFK